MYPVLFQIGSFELRSYGFFVAVSLAVGTWLAAREAQRRGLDRALVYDFLLWAVIAGFAGARLYFVLLSEPGYFLERPWEIPAIWSGGLAFQGGLLAGVAAGLWFCRRRRIPLWRFADAVAPGLILGQTVGQVACLLNGDTFGKPTTLPWAMTFTDPRSFAPLGIPLHPLQVYEGLAYLAVFLLVWGLRRRCVREGDLFLVYVAGYAVARFAMEFFRADPPMIGGLIVPQVVSVLALAAALWFGRRQRLEPVR